MSEPRTIAVVTGSRAEYGLLRPVMKAIEGRGDLKLQVLVTGNHLLPDERTVDEVSAEFEIAAMIPMQQAGESGRAAQATALGRGTCGFGAWLAQNPPDVVLVLGDRIEAFAAAAAASVAGVRVAHLHGGDRAEGIADESIRHAISKMAHIHLPATAGSAQRLTNMGEEPARIHLVGSPAMDELDSFGPMPDEAFESLGRPEIVMLLHPCGRTAAQERANAEVLLASCRKAGRVLAMHPNHDPGREGILEAIREAGCPECRHLPRCDFVGLLRRIRLLAGNSSAGLIECSGLGVRCLNVTDRQAGREMPDNVTDVPGRSLDSGRVERAIEAALEAPRPAVDGRYGEEGDGGTGRRVAEILATFEPDEHAVTKRNVY